MSSSEHQPGCFFSETMGTSPSSPSGTLWAASDRGICSIRGCSPAFQGCQGEGEDGSCCTGGSAQCRCFRRALNICAGLGRSPAMHSAAPRPGNHQNMLQALPLSPSRDWILFLPSSDSLFFPIHQPTPAADPSTPTWSPGCTASVPSS